MKKLMFLQHRDHCVFVGGGGCMCVACVCGLCVSACGCVCPCARVCAETELLNVLVWKGPTLATLWQPLLWHTISLYTKYVDSHYNCNTNSEIFYAVKIDLCPTTFGRVILMLCCVSLPVLCCMLRCILCVGTGVQESVW